MSRKIFVKLKHILPENPGRFWPDFDADTASAYYKRVGNMVLLQAKKNSMIGNSSFTDKKKVLKDSTFLLTSEVARYSSWGIKEINDRQQKLAKIAVQTWPIDVS